MARTPATRDPDGQPTRRRPPGSRLARGSDAKGALADKAYDANALRQIVAETVIPCNPTRKRSVPYNFEAYKARNLIERCFNKLKHFLRFAIRYDRHAANCLNFIRSPLYHGCDECRFSLELLSYHFCAFAKSGTFGANDFR